MAEAAGFAFYGIGRAMPHSHTSRDGREARRNGAAPNSRFLKPSRVPLSKPLRNRPEPQGCWRPAHQSLPGCNWTYTGMPRRMASLRASCRSPAIASAAPARRVRARCWMNSGMDTASDMATTATVISHSSRVNPRKDAVAIIFPDLVNSVSACAPSRCSHCYGTRGSIKRKVCRIIALRAPMVFLHYAGILV